MVRVVRVVGSGTRKRKVYRKRSGAGAIVHRPIRIGIGIRRKTHIRRVRPVVVGSAWQLSSTKRGTGRKRKVGRPRISRARVILV